MLVIDKAGQWSIKDFYLRNITSGSRIFAKLTELKIAFS